MKTKTNKTKYRNCLPLDNSCICENSKCIIHPYIG